jgi:tetratricopeptide (TPR) repeat protein
VPKERSTYLVLALLAALGAGLYAPFLASPAVFDDRTFFSGARFAEYASSPIGLALRQPAYFTLALMQVLSGAMEVHRAVSLAFHVGCAGALYALLRELQRWAGTAEALQSRLVAFGGAAVMLLHPVAVYAAGYLMQRSIVVATLFGLLSLAVFLRGLRRQKPWAALGAAALFSLAVLSKEHALLVPAVAAAAAVAWARDQPRFALRYAAHYLAACAPAAILVVLMAKGVVGQRYEPEFDAVAAQIVQEHGADTLTHPWLTSVLAQAALFFRYAALWLLPRTSGMAIDLKVDFAALAHLAVALPALAGLAAVALAGAYLVSRRGPARIAGFGLLYLWILYLLEFSVIRFQEPFVLYRSYLWAPGLVMALAALAGRLPVRAVALVLVVALPLLALQAYDRLKTFSSGVALWEDAVAKLPAEPVPGGWRTLHILGREYLYGGSPDKAAAIAERCMAQYPDTYHCVMARAGVHAYVEEFEQAIPLIRRGIALRPNDGWPVAQLGYALEQLGCREQARLHYERAYKQGFLGAKYRLDSMDSPGKGLLPASRRPQRKTHFECPS